MPQRWTRPLDARTVRTYCPGLLSGLPVSTCCPFWLSVSAVLSDCTHLLYVPAVCTGQRIPFSATTSKYEQSRWIAESAVGEYVFF